MTQLLSISISIFLQPRLCGLLFSSHGTRKEEEEEARSKNFFLTSPPCGKEEEEEKEVVQHCGNFLTSFSSVGGIGFMQQLQPSYIFLSACMSCVQLSPLFSQPQKKSKPSLNIWALDRIDFLGPASRVQEGEVVHPACSPGPFWGNSILLLLLLLFQVVGF